MERPAVASKMYTVPCQPIHYYCNIEKTSDKTCIFVIMVALADIFTDVLQKKNYF